MKTESLNEDLPSSHSAKCSIGGIGGASAMTNEAVCSGKLSCKVDKQLIDQSVVG